MYFRSTLSMCFCWKRPLTIRQLLPSIEPLKQHIKIEKSTKKYLYLPVIDLSHIIHNLNQFIITLTNKIHAIPLHYVIKLAVSYFHNFSCKMDTYVVPSSARRNCRTCLGLRLRRRQISAKLANAVFLLPARATCGGFITNFFFSPAANSGFFSRMIPKTRSSS